MLKNQLETKNAPGYSVVIKTKSMVGNIWEICPIAIRFTTVLYYYCHNY